MTEQHIDKILGALRGVSLSERERANMRLRLESYMGEMPMHASIGTRAASRFSRALRRLEKVLNSKMFITHPAFAACVLVLCMGIGTSYAAQNALPGEALYSFKTRVNERVQGSFATTPVAKVEWSAELTGRRLLEAEELAATNQLSPVATADIETGLETAVQNFNANIAVLARSDDLQATNAQSDLEASLNAHEVVLDSLPTVQKKNTLRISSLVRKHATTLSNDRIHFEAVLTATDSPAVKVAALHQMRSAKDEVSKAQLLSQTAIDTQVASSVTAITKSATSDISAGDNDAKDGHWGKAYGAFQDAIRKMKENKESVDTRNWLKKRFGIGLGVVSSTSVTTSTKDTDLKTINSEKNASSSAVQD